VTQHFDPAPDSATLDEATTALLTTATALSDADLQAPLRLPGWTRGHVLTHLARNTPVLPWQPNWPTWSRGRRPH
jgi:maleylpyruvate isomerase